MSYAAHLAADRRLAVLENLIADGGSGSESAVKAMLEGLGHRIGITRETVRDLLKDLRERDLIEIEYFRDSLMVARITERGVDAAEGRITVDGVASPPIGRR
ncbi:hypothetical protein GVN24_24695 [Rhizobium sp. CRIBSB]|nr:hypothetical protein [Rhizobium sp. CRIBSB]